MFGHFMKQSTFFDHTSFHSWFEKNKRDFPWRNNPTPYEVWVSEVMLQQTRASVVTGYFERWMKRFPDVHALAGATREEVLKAWEGLGYYSRARNLHEGARQVVEQYGGRLPFTKEQLKTIKGLGPYTVGAILAFGFQKPEAAVDGNVMRVLTRYFLIEDDLCATRTQKIIWTRAEKILERGTFKTSEALIELGATVCTAKKPSCFQCPLKKQCLAFAEDKQESLPYKSKKMEYIKLNRAIAVIESEGHLLIQKNNERLMKDLYEFPYCDTEGSVSSDSIKKWILDFLGLKVFFHQTFPRVQQSFTKYRADLYPFSFQLSRRTRIDHYEWTPFEKLKELSFSSGHRKILKEYLLRL